MSETGEMSTTDEIAAFYAARLDEEEAAAKVAQPGPWTLDEWTGGFGRMACVMTPFASAGPNAKTGLTSLAKLGTQDYETAAHIARHDPERTLRKVKAGRKLILRYQVAMGVREEDHDPAVTALVGQMRDEVTVWDDHPDYQEPWKP